MTSNNFHNNFPGYPLGGRDGGMDINHFGHMPRKDIPTTSPLTSPLLGRARTIQTVEPNIQSDIIRLKQQHEVQQQILLQQFQAQQQHLAAQQEHQLNEHVKQRILAEKQQELAYQQKQIQQMFLLQKQQELLQQKQLEEQQRREQEKMERRQLEQIKNKKLDEQSAIASTAVKQKLQQFVLNKKQREDMCPGMVNSPPQFWPHAIHSSIEQQSPPQSGLSPPYKHNVLGPYADFPLRKTASEPNLKVRSVLKQKVMEKRNSPLLIRKDRGRLQKRATAPLTIDTTLCSSPESGPNSPPAQVPSNGSLSSLQGHNETNQAPLDLSLYASPSMPNISLGRPRGTSPCCPPQTMSPTSEAEVRAMAAARLGLPLTSHALPPGMMFYPSLPVIDSEASSAVAAHQMRVLEQARSMGQLGAVNPLLSPYMSSQPSVGFTPEQVAQARLHRHRPLNRTQSAPLPLPNPLLQQHILHQKQQQEQMLKDKMFVKQHIRNTVLQRVGSKNHMENVDEETEAKLAQEMRESHRDDDPDIMVVGDRDVPACITEHNLNGSSSRPPFSRHQRELVKAKSHGGVGGGHIHRHERRLLARTQSSPLVTFNTMKSHSPETSPVKLNFTTGLAYDNLMLKHQCTCGNNSSHPEHAGRLQSIWARLQETGLTNKCEKVKVRKASIEEIKSVHGESYSLLYGTSSLNRQKLDPKIFEDAKFCMLPCGGVGVDSDTVWNDLHTSHAARMATGCVIELACKVALGELKNGFAVVRPPGHHAEPDQAMGFCYFNSVAITAKVLTEKLKIKKVLVVDWDVHHGNGTQQMLYKDANIMYMSIHRHDNGNFFPGTGAPEECGSEEGEGFNVNVAFAGNLEPPMGDAEYLAAFRTIVMPIAQEYNPDVILVSSGFDAAAGHPPPLGGYMLSPACFGYMTKQLMTLAEGRVVLALEGGYDLPSICDSSEVCVQTLLGDEVPAVRPDQLSKPPNEACVNVLREAIKIQCRYWPCVEKYAATVGQSHTQALSRDQIEVDTVTAMASLSMMNKKRNLCSMSSSESEPMEES